jgi:hypothetical protein
VARVDRDLGAGVNAVDPDTVPCELIREGSAKAGDAVLARDVRCHVEQSANTADRTGQDD